MLPLEGFQGPKGWMCSTKLLMIIYYVKTQIFEKRFFFSYRPPAWPGQARLKKAEKAYISAVNERILKIPFFHENYNEL